MYGYLAPFYVASELPVVVAVLAFRVAPLVRAALEHQKQCLSKSWSYLFSRYLAYKYLFFGASMIENAYSKSDGRPFLIHTPERTNVMITSPQHIREMDKALRRDLSLHAVAKELIQPRHTLRGFVWKDQRGMEGTGFFRAIRNLLTANLPRLIPQISEAISTQFNIELQKARPGTDTARLPVVETAKRIVLRANCSVFFPRELVEDAEFMEAALHFPHDVYVAAEIIRLFPCVIGPTLARLVTGSHKSTAVLYDRLCPIIQRRLEKKSNQYSEGNEPCEANDAIQWLIETAPKRENWSIERLVGEIVAVWYASVHTLAMSLAYVIIDMYSHPEYIESLRKEVEGPLFETFQATSEGLPEVDSFLKESMRLSYFESSFIRRQALRDYQFYDGLKVPRDSWVCIPYQAMLRDEARYPNAGHFDGRRFLHREDLGEDPLSSALSRHSDDWLVWGSGRIVCPGRFYATVVLKLVVAHMVQNYSCELEPTKGTRSVQWRSALIPKSGISLNVTLRA